MLHAPLAHGHAMSALFITLYFGVCMGLIMFVSSGIAFIIHTFINEKELGLLFLKFVIGALSLGCIAQLFNLMMTGEWIK